MYLSHALLESKCDTLLRPCCNSGGRRVGISAMINTKTQDSFTGAEKAPKMMAT
ncbi:hypothetical protein FHX35_002344 [Auritidibacter ignavus]|nr:hypothetical protein [Auritidibacter ignavus]